MEVAGSKSAPFGQTRVPASDRAHGIEHGQILQRPEQRAVQHRLEVDLLLGAVLNATASVYGPTMLNRVTRWMGWVIDYLSGSILTGGWPDCKRSQSCCNSVSMNLRPGLDEPLLRLGQAAAEALDRVDGEDGRVVLVIRVKVRAMMCSPASTNIRMTIPKNRESSGTALLYIVGPASSVRAFVGA